MIMQVCPLCKGKGSVFLIDAAYPDDPPQRQPCGFCGAKGEVKLTTSEALSFARAIEPETPGETSKNNG